jgi:hypothetical protein
LLKLGLFRKLRPKRINKIDSRPKNLSVDEGGSFELFCAVDGYYEWCTFTRPDGKICDFEWKRELWDIDVLQCTDFAGRMTRIGKNIFGTCQWFWLVCHSQDYQMSL